MSIALTIKKLNHYTTEIFNFENENNFPVPSFYEIQKIAKIYDKKEIRIFQVFLNNKIIGIFPFIIEKGRVNGFFIKHIKPIGWNLFDYLPFYANLSATSITKILTLLKKELNKENIQAIHFPQLLIKESHSRNISNYIIRNNSTYFNSKKSKLGWEEITRKKSLKRHRNKIIKTFNYKVYHSLGNITKDDIKFIKNTHIERWKFDNSPSPFKNPLRQKEYTQHKKNKLLTVLKIDNTWLAYHYGMVFKNTLLWHTPVINIKYLNYSPLEILLYETAEYCKTNGIYILDLGLGDEPYKMRFSNNKRIVYDFFFPIGLKGYFIHFIRNIVNPEKIKSVGLLFKNQLRRYKWLKNIFNKIIILKIESDKILCNKTIPNNIHFKSITNYEEFVDICRKTSFEIKKWQYERFKNECIFYCLYDAQFIISWGWGTYRSDSFYVSEINTKLDFKNHLVLFDFNTKKSARNKGFYQLLLQSILKENSIKKDIFIYALESNIASLRAIKKAGFKEYTKLSMIKKIFQKQRQII